MNGGGITPGGDNPSSGSDDTATRTEQTTSGLRHMTWNSFNPLATPASPRTRKEKR